jgi:hypothetical protein
MENHRKAANGVKDPQIAKLNDGDGISGAFSTSLRHSGRSVRNVPESLHLAFPTMRINPSRIAARLFLSAMAEQTQAFP